MTNTRLSSADTGFIAKGAHFPATARDHVSAHTGDRRSRALPALGLSIALAALAGCATAPRALPEPPPPPVVVERASDFTVGAGMLDTWNAVGQILVRTDGVTYEGRSQMLGLYDVAYRGERFLVITRAMALAGPGAAPATRVRTALKDGKPDASAAASDLLELLRQRLPEELRLDASGARGKVNKGHIRN